MPTIYTTEVIVTISSRSKKHTEQHAKLVEQIVNAYNAALKQDHELLPPERSRSAETYVSANDRLQRPVIEKLV